MKNQKIKLSDYKTTQDFLQNPTIFDALNRLKDK
jgi:hypothetical protein